MDQAMRDKLSELVEELTTSGEPQLDPHKMKEVKKICKLSNLYVEHFYHLILTQLSQEHAEIRLSAFQMVGEVFSRSHHFRLLLVSNLQEFLELTVETDAEQPLPPPREVARKLRSLAIRTLQAWQETYGQAYKKLSLGYHFLKHSKKVDFHDVEARTLAERRRQEEKQKRMERIYKEKLDKAKQEMEELTGSIRETLTEMHNCTKLLTHDELDLFGEEPQPCCSKDLREEAETSGQREGQGEAASDREAFLRSSGLMSHRYQLELHLSSDVSVRQTEENEALVETARDLHRLLTSRHLPMVQSWIQVFTKVGVEEALMRRATELKQELETVLRKHQHLHIHTSSSSRERRVMRASEDGEEDEEEFEEVPEKEGYEPHVPEHLRAEYGLDEAPSTSKAVKGLAPSVSGLKRRSDEEQDPTCAAATLRLLRERLDSTPPCSGASDGDQGSAHSSGADARTPVVPFGLDLYYWGEEQPTAGKILKNVSQHQFWVPHEVEEEVENEELAAQSRSRCFTFAGTFKPVEHKCRSPMENGSLCERQDRLKCPFHGVIVPRDELGRPLNPEDAARLEKERRKRLEEQQPDWRDPELMREIEAATGHDLGSSKTYGKKAGKKGSKKKKFPNLTDLKQKANTSRARLEKKVFNKSSIRRVTEVMNKMDKRKHEKFSNQFNYALN